MEELKKDKEISILVGNTVVRVKHLIEHGRSFADIKVESSELNVEHFYCFTDGEKSFCNGFTKSS